MAVIGTALIFSACQQEQLGDLATNNVNSVETEFRDPLILADAIHVNDCCTFQADRRLVEVVLDQTTCDFYGHDLFYKFYNYNMPDAAPLVFQALSLCAPDFCLPGGNYALLITNLADCELVYNGLGFSTSCSIASPIYNVNVRSCVVDCETPTADDISWSYNSLTRRFTLDAGPYAGTLHQFYYRTSGTGTTPPGPWRTFPATTAAQNVIFDKTFVCKYDVRLRVHCEFAVWTESPIISTSCASIGF